MRSLRQIVHGCKKHNYRLSRQIRWHEDEYRDGARSKWICTNCYEVVFLKTVVKGEWMFD